MHNPQYTIYSSKIKEDKTIAVVSDLHINAKTSSRKLDAVIKTLKKTSPTHIVIPGDLYNHDITTIWDERNIFWPFIEQMKDIAPVYYIQGNSEQKKDMLPNWTYLKRLDDFHFLCEDFKYNRAQSVIQDDGITFTGLKIPLEVYALSEKEKIDYLLQNYSFYLEKLAKEVGYESFSVLLCHDPIIAKAIEEALSYDFSIYFDLIIAGHNNNSNPKGLVDYGNYGGKMLTSSGITKYPSGHGVAEKLEHFHQGTVETVYVRQRKF